MKIKDILLMLWFVGNVSLLISCSTSDNKSKKEIIIKESDIVKESIAVNGMTCVGCEVTLEKNISKIIGVVRVKASHTDNEAIIEFDSTKTNVDAIINIIKDSGYKPSNNIGE